MKMSMYVNALGLAALLVSSSCMVAQESGSRLSRARTWVGRKATQLKEKAGEAIDSLITKAKKFSKDVKALRKCHKEGTCTPEEYKTIRNAGAALAGATAVVAVAGIGAAYRAARPTKPVGMTENDLKLLSYARANNTVGLDELLIDTSAMDASAKSGYLKSVGQFFSVGGLTAFLKTRIGTQAPYKQRATDILNSMRESTYGTLEESPK